MIGERLRQGRLRAGLTQDQVVERLSPLGASLTKAGLSKYERGGSVPKPSLLALLARVLGVRGDYLLREKAAGVEWSAFRKPAALGKQQQERIQALAGGIVENQVWLLEKMLPEARPVFPKPVKVRKPEDAEEAAEALRKQWKLGEQPIESVTEAIEDHGGVVVECSGGKDGFHGLSGWAAGKYPVLVVGDSGPDESRRFNLAHELGHLVMDCRGLTEKDQEGLADRFAAAFLVPPAAALREIGPRRRHFSFPELALLKVKYGLGIQSWMRRALDLGMIGRGHYNTLRRQFRAGWGREEEAVSGARREKPARLRLLTLRALAEGVITPEKAEAICPGTGGGGAAAAGPPSQRTAAGLMALPPAGRKRALARAAAAVEREYREDRALTDFEAFGGEDLRDESL